MLGAALAYYSIFALAPFLIIIVSILGLIFGQKAMQGQIAAQIEGFIGRDGGRLAQTILANAKSPSASIVSIIISFVILLFGASGIFGQLKDTLNIIWKVAPNPQMGIWNFIRTRFLSFGMVAVICFLLAVSLVASVAVTAAGTIVGNLLPVSAGVIEAFNILLSVVTLSFLFALINKVLPDVNMPWSVAFSGGIFTSFLFTAAKTIIGVVIGRSSASSTYGAAASLIVILLWVYYSAQIIFLGAEFTKEYAQEKRIAITPSKYGVNASGNTADARTAIPYAQKSTAVLTGYFIAGVIVGIVKKTQTVKYLKILNRLRS